MLKEFKAFIARGSVIELAGIAHPTRNKLTASVGSAWLLATVAHQPGDLLASADACLYEAKRRGRNRTVVAD